MNKRTKKFNEKFNDYVSDKELAYSSVETESESSSEDKLEPIFFYTGATNDIPFP